MARREEPEQRRGVNVSETPCQNSKLKLNPSVKFLRHGEKKDLQLQQNCNSTKREYVNLPAVTKGSQAGFVISLSPLYMEVEKKKVRGV